MLVDYIEAEMAMEALYKIFGGDHDLHHWVATLKRFGSWAGSCAAVFLCRFININIKIVTNARKFWVTDTRTVTRSHEFSFVCAETPTVYLYHNVYNMPFTTSDKCNHFAHMWEVNICVNRDKNIVYYGGCDVSKVVDLTITTPVTKKPNTRSEKYGHKIKKELPVTKKPKKTSEKDGHKIKKGIVLGKWLEKSK